MNFKALDEYKNQNAKIPAILLQKRIFAKYPTYTFSSKMFIFEKFVNDPANKVLGLDFELEDTPLEDINMYNYTFKIRKTIYEILEYALYQSCLRLGGIHVVFDLAKYNIINKLAFSNIRIKIRDMSPQERDLIRTRGSFLP